MTPRAFTGQFTQQEPIDAAAIEAAVAVLKSGRLHRYNTLAGETSQAAQLEADFARWQGSRYCLACASGGYAMQLALKAAGVQAGDSVLTNAFTLAPVPGAIVAVGARPVFLECTRQLTLDLADLDARADTSGARVLLLSHMRGHLVDMDALARIVERHALTLIEDCAHTMGARWNGERSGNAGLAGCFSTQTYKHINSGEGGLLTSDDADFMARAIVLSGSYMLYERHGAAPPAEAFASVRLTTPNCSGRMDNLRAAILRPQLESLETNIDRWNARYRALETVLCTSPHLYVPQRPAAERFVGSSLQFLIEGISAQQARDFLARCLSLGVELKWFGDAQPVGFTSTHHSWRYVPEQQLPATDAILAGVFDLRIPLTFSEHDCRHIGEIIVWYADRIHATAP